VIRVLHVASGREWRGGERQVWFLTRALAQQPVDQALLTSRGSELARRASAAGVRVIEVDWDMGLDPRALYGIICERRANPALVHAHDGHALRLALWSGANPVVATRRVAFPVRAGGTWTKVARVIAISRAVEAALVHGGVAPDRIVVIPDGIPVREVAGAIPSRVRTEQGWPVEAPLVACIAALTPEKGHHTLIDAAALLAARMPEVRWALAGEGPGRARLEQHVATAGLAERVTFLGHIDHVDPLIAEATVVVSAATSEGLGSTLLDAMALGRPIVATAVGGVPELLASGSGALVPNGDAAALAREIERVLRDPAVATAMAATGRRAVEAYEIGGMAERTIGVYRSALINPVSA
jgi:glycosyltransferase involved in cell wall biosynthesis